MSKIKLKNKTVMKEFLKRFLIKLPGRLMTVLVLSMILGVAVWARAAFQEPTAAPTDSDQDFSQNILGANSSDNDFDSSSVAANSDGSFVERLEQVQSDVDTVEADTLFDCGKDTITDEDGNVYGTVKIGSQCWQASNMHTTHYPGGGSITRGPTDASWDGNDNGYYAYPPNVGSTAEEDTGLAGLGYVYQWSAALNGSTTEGAQGICPSGWHIPTDAEWHLLESYLADGTDDCSESRSASWVCEGAGTSLKAGGASGFQGLLTGYRCASGGFYTRGTNTHFWSSSESGTRASYRLLHSSTSTVNRYTGSKAYGFSVRCLKD